jgi:hypothetical protein
MDDPKIWIGEKPAVPFPQTRRDANPEFHHATAAPSRPETAKLRAAGRWRGPLQTRKSGAIFPPNPEIA